MQEAIFLFSIPGGERFEGYACKKSQQVIVALSGSFDVLVHNGIERKTITLSRSYNGLYLPALMWRQVKNFSTNALALIVSDWPFNEEDYVRSFKNFTCLKNE